MHPTATAARARALACCIGSGAVEPAAAPAARAAADAAGCSGGEKPAGGWRSGGVDGAAAGVAAGPLAVGADRCAGAAPGGGRPGGWVCAAAGAGWKERGRLVQVCVRFSAGQDWLEASMPPILFAALDLLERSCSCCRNARRAAARHGGGGASALGHAVPEGGGGAGAAAVAGLAVEAHAASQHELFHVPQCNTQCMHSRCNSGGLAPCEAGTCQLGGRNLPASEAPSGHHI